MDRRVVLEGNTALVHAHARVPKESAATRRVRSVTGYNIFCGGPVHQERHELVMFSRPSHITYPIFVQEAETAGWSYSEPQRRWLCPDCAHASDSTKAR